MSRFTDIMIDTETTGLNPQTSSIIQLSAIKFNLETGEIGPHFDRCPAPLPFRGWNDGTRDFWLGKNRKVYEQIILRQEAARPVYEDFVRWVDSDAPEGGYRFWAKPVSFDWPILASSLEQLELPMPFFYRIARDLNSFCAGMTGDGKHPNAEEDIENKGDAHNSLHDCAFQLDTLLSFKKRWIATEVM